MAERDWSFSVSISISAGAALFWLSIDREDPSFVNRALARGRPGDVPIGCNKAEAEEIRRAANGKRQNLVNQR
jgi:hypothetical protein